MHRPPFGAVFFCLSVATWITPDAKVRFLFEDPNLSDMGGLESVK